MGKAGGFLKSKTGMVGAVIGALAIGNTLMNDTLSGAEKAAKVTTIRCARAHDGM